MESVLNDIIDASSADIIAFTQELIGYDSTYSEDAHGRANAPFGNGVADALEAALSKAAGMGFTVKNVDGYAGIVDMGCSGDLMGAMAHIDIVPAGDGWMYPPFSGTVADGKLYGRGSLDDKGPLVATLYAMKAVLQSGLPIRNRFRLIIGTDEEIAFRGLAYYLTKEPALKGGFSPDGEFPAIYGEKGGLQLHCDAAWSPDSATDTAFHIVGMDAGIRINVVPDYAQVVLRGNSQLHALALAKLREEPNSARYAVDRDGERITISATGVSAHAATPWDGDNAICALLRYLSKLPLTPQAAEDYIRAMSDLFAASYDGSDAGVACRDDISSPLTLCLTMLKLGPEGASGRFDLRYPLSKTKDEIFTALKAAASARGLAICLDRVNKPLYVPLDNPMMQSLLTAYYETTGRSEPPITIGGGTYCREMENTVAFGPVFPGEKELAHERDEYMTLDNLITCAKIYAQAIYALIR